VQSVRGARRLPAVEIAGRISITDVIDALEGHSV
jgi:hypothetical protein